MVSITYCFACSGTHHIAIEILAKRFANMYNSMEDGYPCIGLDLMASNLSFDESVKSHTINRFFTKSKDASAHSANGTEEQLLKQTADAESSKRKSNKIQGGLFSKNNIQEQQQGETYLCDKCNQHILVTSVEEHSDYHFAMDLMNEERQRLQQSQSSSSSSSNTASPAPTKKRKAQPKRLSENDRIQKRSLFFQPKRAP